MRRTRRGTLAALAALAGCTGRRSPADAADRTGTDAPDAASPTPGDTEVAVREAVPFRETPAGTLRLDVVRPAGVERAPVVVFAHGGGWRTGGRGQFRPHARRLARHGYAGLLVEYRLGDAATYPAAVEDVAAAAAWTGANAADLGVDPDRLALAGWSAGAHMAALVALTGDRFAPSDGPAPPPVRAVAGVAGIYDVTRGEMASEPVVEAFLDGTIEERPDRYRAASPVTHVDGDAPPTLLLHAADDPLVPVQQSRWFRDGLREAGGRADLVVADGGGHSFFREDPWLDRTARRLRAFLDGTL